MNATVLGEHGVSELAGGVMRYRPFGTTDFQVSALGFGAMRLPQRSADPADIDEVEAIRMIRTAIDAGVNCVDTAYPYHGGRTRSPSGRRSGTAIDRGSGWRPSCRHGSSRLPRTSTDSSASSLSGWGRTVSTSISCTRSMRATGHV